MAERGRAIRCSAPSTFRSARWSWVTGSFADRGRLRQENLELTARLRLANLQLQRFAALEDENRRLRDMRAKTAGVAEKVLVASILNVDLDPFRHRVLLDKGAVDGVFKGQAVLDGDGIFGQVTKVNAGTAEVILISDPEHAIPVQSNRSGVRTIAVGTGDSEQAVAAVRHGRGRPAARRPAAVDRHGRRVPAGLPGRPGLEGQARRQHVRARSKPGPRPSSTATARCCWLVQGRVVTPADLAPAPRRDERRGRARRQASHSVQRRAHRRSAAAPAPASTAPAPTPQAAEHARPPKSRRRAATSSAPATRAAQAGANEAAEHLRAPVAVLAQHGGRPGAGDRAAAELARSGATGPRAARDDLFRPDESAHRRARLRLAVGAVPRRAARHGARAARARLPRRGLPHAQAPVAHAHVPDRAPGRDRDAAARLVSLHHVLDRRPDRPWLHGLGALAADRSRARCCGRWSSRVGDSLTRRSS